MGCDIHGVVQVKNRDDKEWYTDYDFYNGRNYELFAALAGVRDRFKIFPISCPKGLPNDIGIDPDPILDEGGIWMGDHSFSYLSREELDSFNWDVPVFRSGIIKRDQYFNWDGSSPVYPHCQGIGGGSTKVADQKEGFPEGWTHVKVYWCEPLSNICLPFLEWLQKKKRQYGNYDQFRIVFGFDN